MYEISLRSLKHLKLSVALPLVPYHWNINIRARKEAAWACGVKPLGPCMKDFRIYPEDNGKGSNWVLFTF